MKLVLGLVAVAVAVGLQLTIARFLTTEARVIDLVVILVVYVGLAQGPLAGLVTGSVAGIAQDLLSGGLVGVGGLAKSVVGFVAGTAGQQFIVTQAVPRFFVFFLGTIIQATIVVGILGVIDSRNLTAPYGRVTTQAIGNGLVGVLAFKAVESLPAMIERRRARRRMTRRW